MKLINGDCLDVLKTLDDNSIDSLEIAKNRIDYALNNTLEFEETSKKFKNEMGKNVKYKQERLPFLKD